MESGKNPPVVTHATYPVGKNGHVMTHHAGHNVLILAKCGSQELLSCQSMGHKPLILVSTAFSVGMTEDPAVAWSK